MKRILLFLLLFSPFMSCFSAPKTTIGSAGLGDPIFPLEGNGGIDVQHYDLSIDWNESSGNIVAIAVIDIVATQDLTAFNLDFHQLTIDEIKVNEQNITFKRVNDELTIDLPHLIKNSDAFSVEIHYHGIPQAVSGDMLPGWEKTNTGVRVVSEPVGAKNWFPNNNHPSDKATYRYHISVPDHYQVAANGLPGSVVVHGSKKTHTFIAKDPMASYLATIAIDHYDIEHYTSEEGVPVYNYYYKGMSEEEKISFQDYPQMLTFFSEKFGPYPFESAGNIVNSEVSILALETQTRPVLGKGSSHSTIVHELAHQWFGDYVSLKYWNELWLKESFSRYSEALWQEHLNGRDTMTQWIKLQYESLMGIQFLPKAGYAELLDFLQIKNVRLSELQVSRIINMVTRNKTNPDELKAALKLVPEKGLRNRNLDSVLAPVSFEYIRLTFSEYSRFMDLVVGKSDEEIANSLKNNPLIDFDTLVNAMAEAPNEVKNKDQMYSPGVYTRGALALHSLRLKVGDETFFDILKDWFIGYGNQSATSADFINTAEKASGENLDQFFNDWLDEPVIPNMPEYGLFKDNYR